ncbi:calmodulin-binding transcription activator 1 isoform X1 [Homalodisca vitripennis]|uniref:calmodulin-binding transcription activator 1 isoform X1 n=1 Tax=Homalodisca vitripennis TaxID=197043 RepID=UPI001EEA6427|nr:calmodulin-binding transcription activator 1 isoform X1 [Homalodisca vitripennis]
MCESGAPSYSSVYSEDEPDLNNELEISTAETVEAIVSQLMEKQRSARAAALNKQLECGCPDNSCGDSKSCSQPIRRISAAQPPNNQVSSTTMLNHHHSNGRVMSVAQPQQRTMTLHHPHLGHHSAVTSNAQVSSNTSQQQVSTAQTSGSPLVLSLSQIQGSGGLLILNSGGSSPTPSPAVFRPHSKVILKQEAMEMEVVNSCHMMSSAQQHRLSEPSQPSHRNSQPQLNNPPQQAPSQPEKMDISNGNILLTGGDYDRSYSRRRESAKEQERQKQHEAGSEMLVDVKPFGMHHSDSLSSKESLSSNQFFNETLDLSQEDIQQTLSANMPMTCGTPESQHSFMSNDCDTPSYKTRQLHFSKFSGTDKNVSWFEKTHLGRRDRSSHNKRDETESDVLVSGINPMEFIDVACSPPSAMDDDVFVNLDAFDMLGDFPELEVLDSNSGNNIVELSDQEQDSSQEKNSPGQPQTDLEYREGSANITDYSPEWAYPEGGVKVLVTGPWYSTTSPYTVLFDSFPVPTTLVQSGVLRCYCPAHEVGLATLQVACQGFVISNSAMFEYKTPPREQQGVKDTVTNPNDNLLKFTLLQRLEAMDERLEIKQEPDTGHDFVEGNQLFKQKNLEERLVYKCQGLSRRAWRNDVEDTRVTWCSTHRSMTLLHLAASLGYTKLVCAMLHWRAENSSLLLETEVDALSQDDDGNTPLMWACLRGHTQTALLLYQWNSTALSVTNSQRQSPLDLARANRHHGLVEQLRAVHRDKANISQPESITEDSIRDETDLGVSTAKDEGIFLRPGAVPRNEAQKYKLLSLYVNIPSTNNSVPAVSSSTPSPNTVNNNSNNTNNNNNQSANNKSHGTQTTTTTRDNMLSGSEPTLKSGRQSPAHPRPTKHRSHRDSTKLSRFERSMSLPLSSPHSGTDSAYDSDIVHSPPRRMDFALCEVTSGPRSESPIIDVELLSDEDAHANNDTVGEQEVRVLTLAEQIIAAMPDRIKNESEDMMLLLSNQSVEVMESPLLLDEPPSSSSSCCFDTNNEFNFDHNYRYYDVSTPSSSLSPASSSCLPSPSPSSFALPDSPSPPPTTADFCEFFHASSNSLFFEKDFSNLTLSDREQRELYEAAKIIQKAYRSYKGRKKLEEQDKERAAAILIQNYYRRYKQYAYFKQMTRAAMVIQNGFRSYCEHKRFKKNQEAAVRIQNYYRNYRDQGRAGESTPPTGLKRTYSQRRQHQAARKIQQFMRQSKNKLQRERAERERQVALCLKDAPQKSSYPDSSLSIEQNNSFRAANDTDSPG